MYSMETYLVIFTGKNLNKLKTGNENATTYTSHIIQKNICTVKLDFKELLNKEQIDFKELFTDYQLFYTINLLLNKELLPI